MDIEAVVTERLQKLRQWQAEQQEKLLKEQQMQRKILSHKQDCIYKALGFPIQDFVENTNELLIHNIISEDKAMPKSLDSTLKKTKNRIVRNTITLNKDHNEEEEIESSDCISEVVNDNRNSAKNYSCSISQQYQLDADSLIEGIAPLPLDNATSNERISLDDIPVPSSKKDFQTLLEEKLNKESVVVSRSDSQTKVKKPFLRKGQGLLKFKMSANSPTQSMITRRSSTSSSINMQHVDRTDKVTKTTVQKDAPSGHTSSEKRRSSSSTALLSKGKAIPVTPNKAAIAAANEARCLSETSASDFDSKTQRELEEVRIFELLEEKAENSSFCSTSSTVLAFMQQSTPFKVRERLNRSESEVGVAADAKQRRDNKRMSDTAERTNTRQPFEQFYFRQRSHARSNTINSYWDTITVDDSTKEEALKHRPMVIDETSRNNEGRSKDTPCGESAVIVSLTDSDEEDIHAKDRGVLARETNHSDAIVSHRVRFAEHNEYRTIDLGNVCYLEQDDGNDRSANTSPESSDVEEKSPLNYEEEDAVNEKEAVNASIKQLFLQQDIADNSYYRMMKALGVSEKENSAGCEDESLGDDDEKTAETYEDEEQASVLSSSPSSSLSLSDVHQGLNAHQKEKYILKSEPTTEKTDKATFEPELLKSRLLELEKEIDIFRKESSALLLQRRKLQEDQATLRKEYAEKERNFEENKRRVQIQLEEEKRRLAREKAAMENRIRDAQEKARQNKMERQKAQNLEEELEKLRDELNLRESRWSAAESRYKSELRALRTEISKLKQEIASLQAAQRTSVKNVRKAGGQLFARTDRRVNKTAVATSSREIPSKSSRDLPAVLPEIVSVHEEDNEEGKNKGRAEDELIERTAEATSNSELISTGDTILTKKRESKRERDIESRSRRSEKLAERNADEARKKRDLYKNLLNDVMSELVVDQGSSCIAQGISDPCQPIPRRVPDPGAKYNDDFYSNSASENLERAATTARVASEMERCNRSCRVDDDNGDEESATAKTRDRDLSIDRTDSSLRRRTSNLPSPNMDIVRQIEHSDGRVEYWYSNGNVKKIFPDQGITKMIYYNGDVREIEQDGRVKYFYATTRTWHTTTPDGLEILEFPDGQVERRMSDGTVQVSFPDGATRIAEPNGTEKWTLPDGTVAQTFVNGDKILTLPNGQREVHTKEHKRREYPDGTVKLVYADGTQETRYSSGRKRLRDKDGNLLMDSYDT